MLIAIISLLAFIGLVLSPHINIDGISIFKASGWKLLINLAFLLSASGLGASFAALYRANKYIANLTYDQNQQASYLIRFLLGLISGLILSVVVSDHIIKSDFLEEGIVRSLLAILGGFSADLFYTFLNRMVETTKSLFQGSTHEIAAAQLQAANVKLSGESLNNKLELAANLMKVQQEIDNNTKPEEIRAKLNGLYEELIPGVKMSG